MTLPNLERKDLKLFAWSAQEKDNISVFGSLAEANPQFSKDIEKIQSLPSFMQGWASACTGDSSPALEDMNGLFYVLFYQMAYLFQKGIPKWKSTTDYYRGSFTTDGNGRLYASKTDNNVGNDPSTDDGTHWSPFPTPEEIAKKVSKSGDTMTGRLTLSNGGEIYLVNSSGKSMHITTDGTNWDLRGDATWLRFSSDQFGLTLRDMLGGQDFYNLLHTKNFAPDYANKINFAANGEENTAVKAGYVFIDMNTSPEGTARTCTTKIKRNGTEVFSLTLGNETTKIQTRYSEFFPVIKGDVYSVTCYDPGATTCYFIPLLGA